MQYRCGLTDAAFARSMMAKWGKRKLTWFLADALPQVGASQQSAILDDAFASWSKVCHLTFQQVEDERNADIVVGCGRGRRSDFDGPSGTLAWAGLPSSEAFDGQLPLMFDMDEAWGGGIKLLNVAAHEIGHTLGLSHGPTGCLMAPVYSPAIAAPQAWDIQEAVWRYSKPATETTTPAPTSKLKCAIEVDGQVWVAKEFTLSKGKLEVGG